MIAVKLIRHLNLIVFWKNTPNAFQSIRVALLGIFHAMDTIGVNAFLIRIRKVNLLPKKTLHLGGERIMGNAIIWKTGNGVRKICHIITCLSHVSMTVCFFHIFFFFW